MCYITNTKLKVLNLLKNMIKESNIPTKTKVV